jgi:predicted solute-binding protein
MPAELEPMLDCSDAALIIGDPALRLDPQSLPYRVLDLGEEWWRLARLPMVFAMWAGRVELDGSVFRDSLTYGRARMEDYLERESAQRQVPVELAREYLTRRLVYDIGPAERRGMDEYLRAARELELVSN